MMHCPLDGNNKKGIRMRDSRSITVEDVGTTVYCRVPFTWRSETGSTQGEEAQTVVPFGSGQWLEGVQGDQRGWPFKCWVGMRPCGLRQLASPEMLLTMHGNVQMHPESLWPLASIWLLGWFYFLMSLIWRKYAFSFQKTGYVPATQNAETHI